MLRLRGAGAGAVVALLAVLMSPATQAAEYWYPSQGGEATWAFEDLWPNKGDYDFNDLVVRYRLHAYGTTEGTVSQMNVRMRFVARGASKASGFAISVGMLDVMPAGVSATLGCEDTPLAANPAGGVSFVVLDDTTSVLAAPEGCAFSNTDTECAGQSGTEVLLKLYFDPPVLWADLAARLNPFLFRAADPSHEVHLPGFSPTRTANQDLLGTGDDASDWGLWYTDEDGLPWALDIPAVWDWPIETTEIPAAYGAFATWVQTNGQREKTWWDTLDSGAQAANPDTTWDGSAMNITGACDNCADVFCPSGQVCVKGVCQDGETPDACDWEPLDANFVEFDSDDGYGYYSAVKMDGSGNVFIVWLDYDANLVIERWSPDGELAWARTWGTDLTDDATWHGLVIDQAGDLIVSGTTYGEFTPGSASGGVDAFVTKWSSDGVHLWTRQWGTSGDDYASTPVVTSDGNIYVAGATQGAFVGFANPDATEDIFLTRLNPTSGEIVETFQFETGFNNWLLGTGADALGNIFIAGGADGNFPQSSVSEDWDNFLIKVDPDGIDGWIRQWGTDDYDELTAMGVDEEGNVFVTESLNNVFAISRFSAAGALEWTESWGNVWPSQITVDPSGNALVVGEAYESLDGGYFPVAGGDGVSNLSASLWTTSGVRDRSWQWLDNATGVFGTVDDSNNLRVAAFDYDVYNGLLVTVPCTHINECLLGTHDCNPLAHEVCEDTLAAWTCECMTNYYGDAGDSPWVQVAAGDYHTVGIKADGTLWSWGSNHEGLLGIDSEAYDLSTVPMQEAIDKTWRAVSAGGDHTVAVDGDGAIWTWGNNSKGQLGVGDTLRRIAPTEVVDEHDWASVSAGSDFTIAIDANGEMWAWGSNAYGQLGLGTMDNNPHSLPTRVGAASNWVAVASGYAHSLALDTDGHLYAWGYNYDGACGCDPSPEGCGTAIKTPTQVGSDTWQGIAASQHSIAIDSTGHLWAWGNNYDGQLGLGDNTTQWAPTQVPVLASCSAVAAGEAHTLAICDGTTYACGYNSRGALGQGGVDGDPHYSFIKVPLVTDAVQVEAGAESSFLRDADGVVWTWGEARNLGRDTVSYTSDPTPKSVVTSCQPCPLVDECTAETHDCKPGWESCIDQLCGFWCSSR